MSRPTVTATTEKIYALLPEHYRTSDDVQANALVDFPLLRYLSLAGDQLDKLNVLIDRFTLTDTHGTSDLTDPVRADDAWLTWLAFLVGIDATQLTVPETRLAIKTRTFDAGSTGALARAVGMLIADPGRFTIVRNADGNIWLLRVYAHPTDAGQAIWNTVELDYPTWDQLALAAPDWNTFEGQASIATRDALIANKPAGVSLTVILSVTAWDLLETNIASWTEFEALGTWDNLETGGLYS